MRHQSVKPMHRTEMNNFGNLNDAQGSGFSLNGMTKTLSVRQSPKRGHYAQQPLPITMKPDLRDPDTKRSYNVDNFAHRSRNYSLDVKPVPGETTHNNVAKRT